MYFQVAKLAFTMPTEANKALIVQLTNETRPNRHQDIMNSKMTLTAILKKYPRFMDFQGQLVRKNSLTQSVNTECCFEKNILYALYIIILQNVYFLKILEEFQAQYAEDGLVEQFSVFYAPRLLQYCKTVKPHLFHSVKDLKDGSLYLSIIEIHMRILSFCMNFQLHFR